MGSAGPLGCGHRAGAALPEGPEDTKQGRSDAFGHCGVAVCRASLLGPCSVFMQIRCLCSN